jgi:hypothetical protein
MAAIKNMKNPFDFGIDEAGELFGKPGEFIGEDVNFCKRANEMGLEVWCDPTIRIGHIGEYLY